jgi:hypothetical protein
MLTRIIQKIESRGAACRVLPCPLAEAEGCRGKNEAGQQLLAGAFAAVQRTEKCYWEAELYRLQGDWLGQDTARLQRQGTEANFLRALDVARRHQSKSLE